MISSESNGQMKELVKLQKQARYRKQQGIFIVEGSKMVQEAAQYGKLQKIYLSEKRYNDISDRQQPEASTSGMAWEDLLAHVAFEVVSDAVFRKVSDTVTPQGILGLVTIPRYSLEELLNVSKPQYLLLDDVRDPGNLGTMIRTAEGAGMSAVILSRDSVDLFNPKVVRATMGSVFRMPYCYVQSLPDTIQQIRDRRCEVYATAMEGSVVYDVPDYTEGAAIVIGNEANGISDDVFREKPVPIRIPMEGQLESLNAAVSAAVIMYEINRQKRKG